MRTVAAESLRRHTEQSHTRVETKLNLLDPGLDHEGLRSVLACLHGFWLGAEPAVDGWAGREPELAARLDWPRRRRTGLLAADLARLGSPPSAPAEVWTAPPSTADVLAWLYVAEGSTLGGAVIHRHLRDVAAVRELDLRSFVPYAEGPGPMWRAYNAVLADWTGSDGPRIEAVVRTGVRIFTALDEWCDAFTVRAAA